MGLSKVSIIIPVYNVELYIAECLQSVMNQTYQGQLECIVVDDCGTDRSMEIVARMIAGYDGPIEFRVLHHEKNMGLSCARNTGIDAVTGDYVFFLDSDDWISYDCIDYLVSLVNKGNYEMVVGGFAYYYGDNDERNHARFSDDTLTQEFSGREYLYGWLDRSASIAVWNKLYPIWYLRKTKVYFNKSLFLSEDVLFNFELFHLPSTICRSNRVTYYYRQQRKGSILFELKRKGSKTVLLKTNLSFWLALRRVKVDGFDDLYESYLHYYGIMVLNGIKNKGESLYNTFRLLHQEYPYSPLRLWLQQQKSFHWYKTRMMWSLPTFLGFLWFQLKWWKNHIAS